MADKNENLKPIRSREEAYDRGKSGGIKSGQARRKRRALKEAMNLLLSQPVQDPRNIEKLHQLGIEEENADNQMLIAASALNQAIKGNVKAMYFISDLMGSKAMTEAEKARNKIEKQKLKLEQEKLWKQPSEDSEEEQVIIVNDLEDFNRDEED